MQKNQDVKKQFIDKKEYIYLWIFIICIFSFELIFTHLKYFSSWASLYVCFMLSVIDIYKKPCKKILMSFFCFIILIIFSPITYTFWGLDSKEIDLPLDVILSLFIPFAYYFFDSYVMKPKIKQIQEYENKKAN